MGRREGGREGQKHRFIATPPLPIYRAEQKAALEQRVRDAALALALAPAPLRRVLALARASSARERSVKPVTPISSKFLFHSEKVAADWRDCVEIARVRKVSA